MQFFFSCSVSSYRNYGEIDRRSRRDVYRFCRRNEDARKEIVKSVFSWRNVVFVIEFYSKLIFLFRIFEYPHTIYLRIFNNSREISETDRSTSFDFCKIKF